VPRYDSPSVFGRLLDPEKRTYGHHPLLAMAGDCNEVLAGMLRSGNAGANTAEDHVTVLADALAGLPADWQAGHRPGDPPTTLPRSSSSGPTPASSGAV